ncbi:PTS sugar transporter subunit IIA [Actinomyces radicidentis]|uniref:PTS sugar transporter subunit IIA n=1 Tax=Actinomyces radicidentis TaxID=111015 RepID=UPI0026E0B6D0|nr:PTS sugar transporter subunit IIA [Actinomyces radicidentis]
MSISTHVSADRVAVGHVASWQEAVRLAMRPLVEAETVTTDYVDTVIDNVTKPGGTYMDLGFGFMLAHARPETGAKKTSLAILKLDAPVNLDDDPQHPIQVVIALAAVDTSTHLETMADLAALLSDEDHRNRILSATTNDELYTALAND